MKAQAPNGSLIVGTYEVVNGTAMINSESFERNADGSLRYEYAGGTEVDWDSQKTVTDHRLVRMFVAEDGGIWSEDKVTIDENMSGLSRVLDVILWLSHADAFRLSDSPLLLHVSIGEVPDEYEPELEIVRFTWTDGEHEYSRVFTQEGIAKGRWWFGNSYNLDDHEGDFATIKAFKLSKHSAY